MGIKPAFDAEEIAGRIRALGTAIRAEAGDEEVFLLGILKGASLFLADLIRVIPGAVGYGFIDVVRDTADTTDALEIDFLSYTDIGGRNVYVLKDVVSSGVIENYLLTQLRVHRPKSLHLVALIDRPDARTVDIQTDHHAFRVDGGTFAGYGLESGGRHANLPYIVTVS